MAAVTFDSPSATTFSSSNTASRVNVPSEENCACLTRYTTLSLESVLSLPEIAMHSCWLETY